VQAGEVAGRSPVVFWPKLPAAHFEQVAALVALREYVS
jgi:hypothetical protein